MTAVYDYDAQKWTEDDELYLRQLRDHISLLESPQGPDYATFIGSPYPECLETAKACEKAILANMTPTPSIDYYAQTDE